MAATEFTFLTVDGHGRPLEPGSRASIRSRCMKGVNVRQDSRRSRRKARKASDNVSVAKGTKKSSGSPELTSSYPLTSCGPLVKSLQLRTDELGFDSSRLPSSILRSVVKYNALLVAAYPLEIYLENAEAQGHRMTDNLTLLNENKTLLESIFLAINAVDDLCSGDKLSLRSQRLLCIILSSLNNNLHSASTQRSYSTILIILILLFTAESFQDFGAVATHLDGLRRLLELRETKPVSMDSKLLFKIQQIDLRMSMATGLPLHFPFDYPNPHPVCVIIPPSFVKSRESVSSLKGENSSQLGGLPVADKYEPNSLDQSWKQSSSGRIRSSATWHACILIHALAQPGPKASPTEFYLTA
ncbi:hypothetical protein DER46DRAFT_650211 [Fusarium sp. MPI-SDFR-AT-0072]|nr:hypothetical protein DER46DRAFT_650211 [Fusarium sp. MPI-SDFR-AT-0072]